MIAIIAILYHVHSRDLTMFRRDAYVGTFCKYYFSGRWVTGEIVACDKDWVIVFGSNGMQKVYRHVIHPTYVN